MATHETTIHPFPAQGRTPLTITSEEISRYAELSALVSQLEAQQKALRLELLNLRAAGAEQETDSPYLTVKVRRDG
jgi:ribosomal protein L29